MHYKKKQDHLKDARQKHFHIKSFLLRRLSISSFCSSFNTNSVISDYKLYSTFSDSIGSILQIVDNN